MKDEPIEHEKLIRKMTESENTIQMLKGRIDEQERALVANTTIMTRAIAKNQNNNN